MTNNLIWQFKGLALFLEFDDIEEFLYNLFNTQIKINKLRYNINFKIGTSFHSSDRKTNRGQESLSRYKFN